MVAIMDPLGTWPNLDLINSMLSIFEGSRYWNCVLYPSFPCAKVEQNCSRNSLFRKLFLIGLYNVH